MMTEPQLLSNTYATYFSHHCELNLTPNYLSTACQLNVMSVILITLKAHLKLISKSQFHTVVYDWHSTSLLIFVWFSVPLLLVLPASHSLQPILLFSHSPLLACLQISAIAVYINRCVCVCVCVCHFLVGTPSV